MHTIIHKKYHLISLSLILSFIIPGTVLASGFDGVWTGQAVDGGGTDCNSTTPLVLLFEGSQVFGSAFDTVNNDVIGLRGTINGSNGAVSGSFTNGTDSFGTFSGTVSGTSGSGSYNVTGQSCSGTFSFSRKVSYVDGYDELWSGSYSSTGANCDSGAARYVVIGNTISGSYRNDSGVALISGTINGTSVSGEYGGANAAIGSFGGTISDGNYGVSGTWSDYPPDSCTGNFFLSRVADSTDNSANLAGIWAGNVLYDEGSSCGSDREMVLLIDGTNIRGTIYDDNGTFITGTINSNGQITNGDIQVNGNSVGYVTGSFSGTSANLSYFLEQGSSCHTGTMGLGQQASYVSGYGQLWTGTFQTTSGTCSSGTVKLTVTDGSIIGSYDNTGDDSVAVIFGNKTNNSISGSYGDSSASSGDFTGILSGSSGSGTWQDTAGVDACSGTFSVALTGGVDPATVLFLLLQGED